MNSSNRVGKLSPQTSNPKMNRVLHFELKPTIDQEKKLFGTFYLCRKLYNRALEERINHYRENGKGLIYQDQQNRLPSFKQINPAYKTVQSQVLQDVLRRLDTAFVRFFEKKAGYPRFKNRFGFRSITLPQSNAKRNFGKAGFLYFPKIGQIKLNAHQAFEPSQVKNINVKYQNSKWYANLTMEIDRPDRISEYQSTVGIDMGINYLVATSDGETYENPRWLQQSEHRLKKAQRKLSKKQKKSRNRYRAKQQLQKLHNRITNQRKDYLHKLSYQLVERYDLLCIEDLQVKGMMKNHRLAKSIANASWGLLTNYLAYKCEQKGRGLIKVNPRNTSQTCHACCQKVPKDLSIRVHDCPYCGTVIDRDINAAKNILQRGLEMVA
jgi:putative transposase